MSNGIEIIADREMKIDRVESYWYSSGRNSKTYVEITFWYDPFTLKRVETKRTHSCYYSEDYNRPDWAKVITERNESVELK